MYVPFECIARSISHRTRPQRQCTPSTIRSIRAVVALDSAVDVNVFSVAGDEGRRPFVCVSLAASHQGAVPGRTGGESLTAW